MKGRSGWKEATLEELVFFQRGYDITKSQQKSGVVPVISSSGVSSFHDEAMAPGPGVVVGRKGTIGSIHLSEVDYWPHDTTLWSRSLNGNDARFVYYYLHTIDLKRFDVGNSNPTINRNHIHKIPVRIPPHKVQSEIADRLSLFDNLIENNRRRIALLEESARLLYREWFVHLRFPGHEHVKVVDGVPEGWGLRTIADMFVTTSGGTPSRANPEYFDGATNWVKTQELDDLFIFDTEEHISESAIKNSAAKIFPAGTLLVSIYGGTNIGRTGLLAVPAASNQACVALMPKKNGNDVYFAQKWLQENKDYLVGLGQGAAQTNISQQTLRSQAMLVPGEGLLNEFTSHAQQAYQQIANLCLQNRRLRESRDLLLPRLMSGEIQV